MIGYDLDIATFKVVPGYVCTFKCTESTTCLPLLAQWLVLIQWKSVKPLHSEWSENVMVYLKIEKLKY